MGYTIGSGTDSRQDVGFTEQDFLNRFIARQSDIVAYKRLHGGDLEGAYQAVTGEPWPAGRSVKIHGDGRAELTKDRTVKSVLGKYVAPIAAGVAAPFVLPALLGGGAAGGAAAAGGGGVAGGGLGTGALAAGATIPGAGMVSGIGPGLAAAGSIPGWVKPAVAAAPLAQRLFRGGSGSSSGSSGGGMDDQRSAQLAELTQLLIDKAKRTTPVHEAAMRMAQRLAPSGEVSPRMTQAIETARTPRVTPSTDPRVLEAMQRLFAGAT